MADEYQAGAMVLSQIGMFNEAVILFDNVVEPAVLGALDECAKAFVKAEHWGGNFELVGDDSDCWLAPAQWNVGKDNNEPDFNAWFAIDCINGDDDSWTALFCSQGNAGGEAGFMFCAAESKFGKKRAWNKSFNNIDEVLIADLKKYGFKRVENDGGKNTFFLPVRLDAAKLAETWGNDGEFSEGDPCFEPVKVALAQIKTAWPIFDAILESLSSKSLNKNTGLD